MVELSSVSTFNDLVLYANEHSLVELVHDKPFVDIVKSKDPDKDSNA